MGFTLEDRAIRPITADEAIRMSAAGILPDDERVELLHGVFVPVDEHTLQHAETIVRLTRRLAPLVVAGRHDVRVQLPQRVPDPTSLPQPDIAVVERDHRPTDHPRTALLVVEVS